MDDALWRDFDEYLVTVTGEVLVWQREAFAGSSWTWEDMRELVAVHYETQTRTQPGHGFRERLMENPHHELGRGHGATA